MSEHRGKEKGEHKKGATCHFRRLIDIQFECNAEIRQLDVAVFGCEDVGTLDVAMQHSLAMDRQTGKKTTNIQQTDRCEGVC